MKSTRAIKACAAISAAGLLMAACGSSTKSTAVNTTTATGTQAPAPTAAATTQAPGTTTAGGGASGGLKVDTSKCTKPTGQSVKLQLQWVAQSQFAGYYAALDQGYFKDAGIDVKIVELTDSTVVPAQQVSTGAADFAISWVPKALAAREAGAKVTDIAQVFQRSGTLQVSPKAKNITTAADFKGKKIGNWGFGNEYEIFADLSKNNLDPAKDVTLVAQQFDVSGLLNGDIDAIEAMTYNEYAQVLEATNKATGKQYTPDDLNVVSYEKEGVGMLQDAIWADQTKLSDPKYCGEAVALVQASLKGWAYCRDNVTACRDIVMKQSPKYGGASHQLWQLNEINALIWPSPDGVGVIDQAAWDRTVKIAAATKNLDGKTVLTKAPDPESYTNDIVNAAVKNLSAAGGADLKGADFKKQTLTVTAGGN
jgi:NitT/TauT family transport system substrate-binding protein